MTRKTAAGASMLALLILFFVLPDALTPKRLDRALTRWARWTAGVLGW